MTTIIWHRTSGKTHRVVFDPPSAEEAAAQWRVTELYARACQNYPLTQWTPQELSRFQHYSAPTSLLNGLFGGLF